MDTIEINLPQKADQLNKAGLYLLMQAKLAGATVEATMQFISAIVPASQQRSISKLPSDQQQEFYYQLFEGIKPLFQPIDSLPHGFRIKRKYLPDSQLTLFTFGEWCLLAETIAGITQADEPSQEQLNTLNALLLRKHHSQPVDIKKVFPKLKLAATQQLLVVDYALGCFKNILKTPQYDRLFEPEKQKTEATEQPTFGWFSVANDLAKQQSFGSHTELLNTNMHQVLIYLTDEREKQSKQALKNELEAFKNGV
jgi:hypothetical protein